MIGVLPTKLLNLLFKKKVIYTYIFARTMLKKYFFSRREIKKIIFVYA